MFVVPQPKNTVLLWYMDICLYNSMEKSIICINFYKGVTELKEVEAFFKVKENASSISQSDNYIQTQQSSMKHLMKRVGPGGETSGNNQLSTALSECGEFPCK